MCYNRQCSENPTDGQNAAATAQSALATVKALGDQYSPQIETAQALAQTADTFIRKLSETPAATPSE